MRAFIAIELSKEIKDFLSRIQEKLKLSGCDVKWVSPKNIHLTLKFLGEINEEQLAKINQIVSEAAVLQPGFDLRLASIGSFPKISSPRVIWVGIGQGKEETKKIAAYLEEKISLIGIPAEEKEFSSHITIGRVRSPSGRQNLIQGLREIESEFEGQEKPQLKVTKITLFKSTLTPQGPVYEALKEANLKAI